MKKKFSVMKAALVVVRKFVVLIGLVLAGSIIWLAGIIVWALVEDCYDNLKLKIKCACAEKKKAFAQQVADAFCALNGQPPSYCTDEETPVENGADDNGENAKQKNSPGADDQTQEKVGEQ